jgi:transcriptional repressor NrdR
VEDEAALEGKQNHELPSKVLGEMVLKKLYEVDRVAYVRFASVYKSFDSVDEFVKEIEKIASDQSD